MQTWLQGPADKCLLTREEHLMLYYVILHRWQLVMTSHPVRRWARLVLRRTPTNGRSLQQNLLFLSPSIDVFRIPWKWFCILFYRLLLMRTMKSVFLTSLFNLLLWFFFFKFWVDLQFSPSDSIFISIRNKISIRDTSAQTTCQIWTSVFQLWLILRFWTYREIERLIFIRTV